MTIIDAEAGRAVKVNTKRLEHLDTFMQELTDKGVHTASAVRVLRHGEEIFSGAYGALTPDGPPMTMDAIIPMSSVTKVVTATLLGMLQEEGVIDFCDKLSRYYPEFKGGKKDAVEIWQLLCHSSGMSDEGMGKFVGEYLKDELGITLQENSPWDDYRAAVLRAREKLGLPEADSDDAFAETEMRLKLMAPLKTDPYTAFDYCSTAYLLLGKLIEKLTGEDLDSYAARKLFAPLGMLDTHFNLPKEKWHRVLKRDPSFCFAGWLNSDFVLTDTGSAGSMKSTVRDLAQLGQMYLQEGTLDGTELLSPASVRLLTTNHNARLPDSFWFGRILGSAWGLGWHVRCGKRDDLGLLRSDRTYDHGGAGGARLVIDPDAGLVFSLYMVDQELYDSYMNHGRVANIIYAALT